jgi:hypothetical protein
MGGRARRTEPKPLVELRPAAPARNVANCDRDGLLLADKDHERLTAGDAGVEEISLEHGIVLGQDGMITAGYSEPWLLWMVAA